MEDEHVNPYKIRQARNNGIGLKLGLKLGLGIEIH